MLADRNQPGDTQEARTLVDAALPVAVDRGYGYIGRDARAVLQRLAELIRRARTVRPELATYHARRLPANRVP